MQIGTVVGAQQLSEKSPEIPEKSLSIFKGYFITNLTENDITKLNSRNRTNYSREQPNSKTRKKKAVAPPRKRTKNYLTVLQIRFASQNN